MRNTQVPDTFPSPVIRDARLAAKLTLQAVGDELGWKSGASRLSSLEHARYTLTLRMADRILAAIAHLDFERANQQPGIGTPGKGRRSASSGRRPDSSPDVGEP